ncbi:hypothetical protein [Anaerobacillus alkalilacustris]|nr:hypothetical protein [Anaerobacillus alkalilacustris]
MDEKKQELEALLTQLETNLTTYGKERIEELKKELFEIENYE